MAVRRLLLVVAGLALVAGCGGTSDDRSEAVPSSASPTTPEPVRVFSLDELRAALPRSSQVPTSSEKSGACPGDDSCRDDTVSVSVRLSRPVSTTEQEKLAGNEFVNDFVQVAATAEKDDAAAAAALVTSREGAARYDGPYDIAAESTSETTYTPAEKGQGSIVDVTIDGWTGFDGSREQVFADPEGEGTEHRYQASQVQLVKGSAVLSVFVTVMSEPRGEGGASALARQLATEYIARLG